MRRRFNGWCSQSLLWGVALGWGLGAPGVLGATETARLVRDINPSTDTSYAGHLGEHDGRLFFAQGRYDYGLWVTDGTAEGSLLLTKGYGGSTPWSQTHPVVSAGRYAYFVKYDSELWRTDGTREGTERVYRFELFVCGYKCIASAEVLGAVGNRVLVSAFESTGGHELWVSDGTTAGTRRLRDIAPGPDHSHPWGFAMTSRLAFFTARDPAHDHELWVTDGTPGGTRRLADINPAGSSNPRELTVVGETVFFTADDGEHGRALWASDGTRRGTRLVRVIRAGRSTSEPKSLVQMGGDLYFTAWQGGHLRLWRSDGTGKGTVRVANVGHDDFIAVTRDRIFFAFRDDDFRIALWTSDGTAEGTRLVKVIRPGGYGPLLRDLTAIGDEVYFVADDTVHGEELWRSDGTEAGTHMVADLKPGDAGSEPRWITGAGGKVFFTADDGLTGTELWYVSGSEVHLVDDFDRSSLGADIKSLTTADDRLFFRANDGLHGFELWSSDGTRDGTVGVDICPGFCNSVYPYGAQPMAAIDGTVFFQANEGRHGEELWKSDGTLEGTVLVKDIASSEDNGSQPGPSRDEGPYWGVLGDRLFFPAWQAASGRELWVTDGSEEGTVLVADLRPGKQGSLPRQLVAAGSRLFFVANDGETGNELWVSDGTAEGTRLVADIRPGSESPGLRHMAARGDELFFSANDGFDREVWRSDGTAAGTYKITDVDPRHPNWEMRNLAVAGETVVFVAGRYDRSYQYWTTDGSAGGETVLLELEDFAYHFVTVGERVFFSPSGYGLWVTDGTADGTRKLREGRIESPAPANGRLYFTNPTNRQYSAIWESDGTPAGTRALVEPTFPLAYDTDLAVVGGLLYFVGAHPQHGAELFTVDLAAASGSAGVVALGNLDGLGAGEVATLAPGSGAATVVDAASGETIGRSLVEDGGWQPLEIEALDDLDGNGAPELAILARRLNRQRVFVHDALTGRRLSAVRLSSRRPVLDLEPVLGGRSFAVLLADPRDYRRWDAVVLDALDGGELVRQEFSHERHSQEVVDFEVFRAEGEDAAAVLNRFASGDLGRLVARGLESGRLLGDWTQDVAQPQDLELLGFTEDGAPRFAILATRQRGRAVWVQIATPAAPPTKRVRFGRRFEAIDLAVLPTGKGALVSVLLDDGDTPRVTTRRVRNGRKRSVVDFPGVSEATHLTVLAPGAGLPSGAAAVVGKSDCAGGGYALIVRDLGTGELVSCSSLAPGTS